MLELKLLEVSLMIKEWADKKDYNLKGKNYIIQGFGNVGYHTCVVMHSFGMNLIAVKSDHSCYLYAPEGLNIFNLKEHSNINNSVKNYEFGI